MMLVGKLITMRGKTRYNTIQLRKYDRHVSCKNVTQRSLVKDCPLRVWRLRCPSIPLPKPLDRVATQVDIVWSQIVIKTTNHDHLHDIIFHQSSNKLKCQCPRQKDDRVEEETLIVAHTGPHTQGR